MKTNVDVVLGADHEAVLIKELLGRPSSSPKTKKKKAKKQSKGSL